MAALISIKILCAYIDLIFNHFSGEFKKHDLCMLFFLKSSCHNRVLRIIHRYEASIHVRFKGNLTTKRKKKMKTNGFSKEIHAIDGI